MSEIQPLEYSDIRIPPLGPKERLKMPLDGSILGNCASEQMEALERDYGQDEDVQVGTVITIVEIQRAHEVDEEGNMRVESQLRMRHNSPDPFRIVGLMEQALHNILASP